MVFSPLTPDQIGKIIDLAVDEIRGRLSERGISVLITDEAKELIRREAYNPSYGARPVKRYLQRHVETKIAELIVSGTLADNSEVCVAVKNGKLDFAL